ncbi:MAG: hypothetical protein A2X56_05505 [Nitrospirae bacterium GWC2_57_13]|nr:MAG: hypothetical protein A2X56_05505 [Nitrospirae bacterium GWC2_57_13]
MMRKRKNTAALLSLMLLLLVSLSSAFVLNYTPVASAAGTDHGVSEKVKQRMAEGERLFKAGKLAEAKETYEQTLEDAKRTGDKSSEAGALKSIGNVYFELGKTDLALEYYQRALDTARAAGAETEAAKALSNIGHVYYKVGQYSDAVKYLQQSLAIAHKLGDTAVEIRNLGTLGVISYRLGKNADALMYLQRYLKLVEKTGEHARVILSLKLIGGIYESSGQYEESLMYYERWLEIARQISSPAEAVEALRNIGSVYYRLYQYHEALRYHQQSLQIARKLGDATVEVRSLDSIGHAYYRLSRYQDALKYHQQSLALKRKISDVAGEAGSLNNIGNIYMRLGQYTEAMNCATQALEISRRIGNAAEEAASLRHIANGYYGLSRNQQALEHYQQSLVISRKIGDTAGEASSLNSVGLVYDKLGQYTEALSYQKRALDMAHEIGDANLKAAVLNNIGGIHSRRGQHTAALNYFHESLKIARKTGDAAGEAAPLGNIGLVYDSLGRYAEALSYHQQALEIKRKIGDAAGEATSLVNIGNIHSRLGQDTDALMYYQQSLEIIREIGDVGSEAAVLNNIGFIYSSLGRYEEALKHHQQSLEIARKSGNSAGEVNPLNNIGLIHYMLERYGEALKYYEQSLKIARRIGDSEGMITSLGNMGSSYNCLEQYETAIKAFREGISILETIDDAEALWRYHRWIGESLRKSGKPAEAVTHYQQAIVSIEHLYINTQGLKDEARSSLIGEKAFVYQEFIELLLELHQKRPGKGYDKQAFEVSEKSKSRAFQEMMAKAGARTAFAGDARFQSMIETEQQLIGQAVNLRQILGKELSMPAKEQNREIIDSLTDQLAKAERSLADHQKAIDDAYPRYADLKRPKALSVEDLKDVLKDGEIVVSYIVTGDNTIAFVISGKGFNLIELPVSKKELADLVSAFRTGLDSVRDYKDLEKYRPEAAHELYQKLFRPLSAGLKDITTLYISGDDVLHTLPFEALVDGYDQKAFREARKAGRKGDGPYLGEYSTLHYLVDSYTIAYLPSASVLRSLRKYEKPGYGNWDKQLIAFADPVFSPEEVKSAQGKDKKNKEIPQRGITQETELALQILTRSTGGAELARLKESSEEAKAIAKEVKGRKEDIYMREKATEENVGKTKLTASRYLLFSTHGLLGGDFSGVAEPALALTLINNPAGTDGFLTMSEVLGLDLNAEMVILSACNTSGKGDKTGSGEGFAGLTRSFMYAGTKSLLVTHWSVESTAARDLMVGTFKEMTDNTRPEALRKAKLAMKASSRMTGKQELSLSHPFFWAPFVMVGEGQ